MTLDEERQERSSHLVLRCDMSIEDIKSEIDFILGHPKREWVGLTNEEKNKLVDAFYGTDIQRLEAIEAKLKEKNT